MTAIASMTGLEGAVVQVQAALRARLGTLREVPNYPPETPTGYPFVITIPGTGELAWNTTEDFKGLHNLTIELHLARKRLDLDVETLFPYIESLPNAIFDAFKDNDLPAIETFGGEGRRAFSYQFGRIDWDEDIKTIGIVFTMLDVKILTNIT